MAGGHAARRGSNSKKGRATRSKERVQAAKQVLEDQNFVEECFRRYDTSNDGFLEVGELKALLVHMNNNEEPSQEEVDMVMSSVDSRGGNCDGKIGKDELREVLLEYRNYKEHSGFIEEKFALYDADKSGQLNRAELQKLLTDLNEGQEVQEADLDIVMGSADKGEIKDGCIDKTELVQAIAVWFSNCVPESDYDRMRSSGSFTELDIRNAASTRIQARARGRSARCTPRNSQGNHDDIEDEEAPPKAKPAAAETKHQRDAAGGDAAPVETVCCTVM